MKKIEYYSFGIDIGGTNTKISIFHICSTKKKDKQQIRLKFNDLSLGIKLIDSTTFKTVESGNNLNNFIDNLYRSFNLLLTKNNINKNYRFAFSFATPGLPDNLKKRVIGGAYNIEFLNKIDFKKVIRNFDKDYLYLNLINDVTSQGYYEQVLKKDKFINSDDIALLIAIGTGIGGAIFSKDKIILGHRGWAAEFGHLPIWFESMGNLKYKCTCGKLNCIETFASARAYINMLKEKGLFLNAEEAILKFLSNDSNDEILTITEFWLDSLSSLISSLIYIFNPSIIIIGGSIAKIEKFSELLYNKTKEKVNPIIFENVKFYPSSSAVLAGTYGAVIHGITAEFKKIRRNYASR